MKLTKVRNQGSWVQFAAVGLSLAFGLNAHAGAGGSGGGAAVKDAGTGRMVLLDFLTEYPRFDASTMDTVYGPDKIKATPFAMTVGYDRVKAKSLPAYITASERLNAWQASSPVVIGLIRTALDSMDWVFTPYQQEVCSPEKIPGRFDRASTYSAVVYNEKFGARMSLPVVNQMGHTSLSGLLIHEALRHVSIAYQDTLSDETLRHVTARIVLSNPAEGETLDRAEWFGGSMGTVISDKQSHQELFDSICDTLQKYHRPDERLCSVGKAIASQFVRSDSETASQRSEYQDKLNEFRDAVTAIIAGLSPSTPAEFDECKRLVVMRDRLTWTIEEFLAGGFAAIVPAMVDATHQLNQVFLGMDEDHLRRYLSGDHSGVGILDKWKLNGAIFDAKKFVSQTLRSGTVLSCPTH